MAGIKEHILVIRLSAMGDCALAVPVLLTLKKQYPELQLTVLTKPFFKPIFELLPDVRVMEVDTKREYKGFLGVVRLGVQLRKEGFTKVADLHNVLRSKILRTLFRFSKVSSAKIDKGRKHKKALTRLENKVFKPLLSTPERYASVFRQLGYPVDLSDSSFLPTQDIGVIKDGLKIDQSKPLIGIAPFAAHAVKAYPLDLMEVVLADFNSQDCQLFLFGGGKKEERQLKALEEQYGKAISVSGKLTFGQELALISHLDVMLSMDSGNGHLAAMFGRPVVTLWGATHPYAGFTPFGQPMTHQILPDLQQFPLLPTSVFGNKVVPGYQDVMRTIDPQRVIDKVKEILEARMYS